MSPLIMVIDDDLEVLMMVGQMLDLAGYQVLLFPTVFDDIADVAAHAPDLIMIDMMIEREPKGANMLGSILGHPATAHIPVIACTGAAKAACITRDFLRELGIPLLHKPFMIDDLLQTVERTLDARSHPVHTEPRVMTTA